MGLGEKCGCCCASGKIYLLGERRFDESCICYSYDLYLYVRGLGNIGRERKIEFDRIKRKLDIRQESIFERNILYEWLFVSSRRSVIFLYMKMFYI